MMRAMKARYSSACKVRHKTVKPGDRILWEEKQKGRIRRSIRSPYHRLSVLSLCRLPDRGSPVEEVPFLVLLPEPQGVASRADEDVARHRREHPEAPLELPDSAPVVGADRELESRTETGFRLSA
jgi:hypothetical protein